VAAIAEAHSSACYAGDLAGHVDQPLWLRVAGAGGSEMSLSGPCLIVLEDPLVSLCRGWACRMVDDYLEPSKGGAGRTRCWRPRREAARHVGSACACCPTLPRLARADLAEPNERPGPALPLMATASRTGTPDRIGTGATALREGSTGRRTVLKSLNVQVRATIGVWSSLIISGNFWTSCCPSVARALLGRPDYIAVSAIVEA
jgi:hypothetical protein